MENKENYRNLEDIFKEDKFANNVTLDTKKIINKYAQTHKKEETKSFENLMCLLDFININEPYKRDTISVVLGFCSGVTLPYHTIPPAIVSKVQELSPSQMDSLRIAIIKHIIANNKLLRVCFTDLMKIEFVRFFDLTGITTSSYFGQYISKTIFNLLRFLAVVYVIITMPLIILRLVIKYIIMLHKNISIPQNKSDLVMFTLSILGTAYVYFESNFYEFPKPYLKAYSYHTLNFLAPICNIIAKILLALHFPLCIVLFISPAFSKTHRLSIATSRDANRFVSDMLLS